MRKVIRPIICLHERWSPDRLCDWCTAPADAQDMVDGSLACYTHCLHLRIPVLFSLALGTERQPLRLRP